MLRIHRRSCIYPCALYILDACSALNFITPPPLSSMPEPAATTADPNIRTSKKKTTKDRKKIADSSSPLMVAIDILRVVVLAVIVFLSLSYYITAGESYLFGYRPWFTRPDVVRQYFVRPPGFHKLLDMADISRAPRVVNSLSHQRNYHNTMARTLHFPSTSP